MASIGSSNAFSQTDAAMSHSDSTAPKELPKFFDALSESFRDNDTVPDPSGELRADANGRVALVQEYESGPILLVAYRTA